VKTAMNHTRNSFIAPLARLSALGLLGALAGCNIVPPAQEDATRYFVLSEPAAAVPAGVQPRGQLRIGLRSVAVEGYLKRREMIVRTGENEVAFKDYRRWAEPLDTAISRIVQAALLASPSVAEVDAAPFPIEQKRDFDVSIRVIRCEGAESPSGKFTASLSAIIEIFTTGEGAHVVGRRLFVAPPEAWDGANYDQLASLLSLDAAALGRDVLAGIPSKD
jgi:uncharacterized lipoprotein YmbA